MERKMSGGASSSGRVGGRAPAVLAACAAVGAAAFAAALLLGQPQRAWQAFHVNFLFWTGLAFAGVVISAILRLTDSRWGLTVRRLGECGVAFVPVALLLFAGEAFGWRHIGPSLAGLSPGKQAWLAPSALLLRDGIALAVLAAGALAYVCVSLRPDLGAARDDGRAPATWLVARLSRGWRGPEREAVRSRRITVHLGAWLVLAYCLVFTLLGIDLIMALDPTWTSTLFGAYFFITNLYLGWAALSATAGWIGMRDGGPSAAAIDAKVRHSLGTVFFAFCFLSVDFFWSQFLVIWYGNLPEEAPFVLRRIRGAPWGDVAFAVLLFCYAVPFFALLFKRLKRDPRTLFALGALVVALVWLERFLLVVPSVWRGAGVPFGPLEIGVTLGFAGLFGVSWSWLARRVPLQPAAAVVAAQEAEAEAAEREAADG
jgi:hypothetical protein